MLNIGGGCYTAKQGPFYGCVMVEYMGLNVLYVVILISTKPKRWKTSY